ncbi:polysaccharide biosynthesis protein [Cytobacillus kochii]|uniref:polysaccharide biosynthesis protein n=1 Tax=Cytobacillus kochii TaxID=859143 RepID=UPI00203E0ACC|nr:nucleoside-diphosphate sugar epimerase/dehydratase [Cytobacillus kochii]MCM3324518.1 polysaccharide biosynthesis protein [Cytobacillus kochii]MCM3346911.1 polysaccharide biosynthesis protein [Cytobacillus kochii]
MSYRLKLIFSLLMDAVLLLSSFIFTYLLLPTSISYNQAIIFYSLLLLFYYIFAYKQQFYEQLWSYASIREFLIILRLVGTTVCLTMITYYMLIKAFLPQFTTIYSLVLLIVLTGSRYGVRVYREQMQELAMNKKKTLIIGAGSAGGMLAKQLMQGHDQLIPVGFIDDDYRKQGLYLAGLKVLGKVEQLREIVHEMGIEHLIIAIPSLKKEELEIIFNECTKTNIKTQTLPFIEDIVMGEVKVNHIRDVKVEDLLGREPILLEDNSISEYIANQTVLVSGAGGSIGSEICRQILNFSPKRLILLGHGENSIYSILLELVDMKSDSELIPVIADIQDKERMIQVMKKYQPAVVYHAAAHKHVPLMEEHPEEAVKNNIIGTRNMAEAAHQSQVNVFVMVSTDKAVNPTSVMGSSKRLAEMLVQQMNKVSATRFVAVRFGNVLGSRGSVIPLFKKQIEKGGPITVTHPDMVRYFMTIPEASRLVLQAGALALGGEIFILDMGKPVRIYDLAKNLIKLSGYTTQEISIKFTGIRQGEKLFEELLNKEEMGDQQIYPHIYIGKSATLYIEEIESLIDLYPVISKEELRERLLTLANRKETPEKQQEVANMLSLS